MAPSIWAFWKKAKGEGVYNNQTSPLQESPVVPPPIKNIRQKETGLQKKQGGCFPGWARYVLLPIFYGVGV